MHPEWFYGAGRSSLRSYSAPSTSLRYLFHSFLLFLPKTKSPQTIPAAGTNSKDARASVANAPSQPVTLRPDFQQAGSNPFPNSPGALRIARRPSGQVAAPLP